MQIKDILQEIELFAPLSLQESYDNSGMQVGNVDNEVTGALLTLDVTEQVIDEAIDTGCNLVVAHHPLIFSGLKKITGRTYVERVLVKAIRNDIAIYAAHTNLDNVYAGVNNKIAEKLALKNTRILAPAGEGLYKLSVYVPKEQAAQVLQAMFDSGAGKIGQYSECSFGQEGTGTFRPASGSTPFIGQAGGGREAVAEIKLEVLVPKAIKSRVLQAMKSSHPYEEVAYDLFRLENTNPEVGAGMIGELPAPLEAARFLDMVKTQMAAAGIRYTAPLDKPVRKVAVCGGSGSFLLPQAIAAGADVFLTADFKYHQFFDAEGKIMIADIGHYETEQFTIEIFAEIIKRKFPNFALRFSKLNTNPVNYYF